MLPGDIVFLADDGCVYAKHTKEILVYMEAPLGDDELEPSDMTGRAGVMRVCENFEGETIGGFIVDLRCLGPSDLAWPTESEVADPNDEVQLEEAREAVARSGYLGVLAVTLTSPDKRPHFIGEERLKPSMIVLMQAVDERRKPSSGSKKVPKSAVPREEKAIARLEKKLS